MRCQIKQCCISIFSERRVVGKNCLILKDKPGKVEATYFTVMCSVRLLAKTVAVNITTAVYSGIIQSIRTVHFQA